MPEKKTRIFAHRGGRRWAPENTLAAFAKCIEHGGIDGIEIDVHRCKSGELVVMHDERLSITSNGTGIIGDTTYDDLKNLVAGKADGIDQRIPLLSEVLALVDGKLIINIEVKNQPTAYPGVEDDLITALSTYQHKDKIVISCFDHDFLVRFHQKAPEYRIAMLINGLIAGLPGYAKQLGSSVWHPMYVNLRSDSVKEAQTAGLEVNIWTPNTTAEWDTVISWGVDSICTDDPQGLYTHMHKAAADGAATTDAVAGAPADSPEAGAIPAQSTPANAVTS